MNQIIIHKRRTKIVEVHLPYDVSQDVITSQIRRRRDHTSPLIAEWDVRFKTDGTDGNLIITLDDSVTSAIDYPLGYMDMKRVSGGEPFPVFEEQLQVIFKEVITE